MTTLLIETPSSFFFDLLAQSSADHKIALSEDVNFYLLNLLTTSIADATILTLDDSISLKYLQAAETRDLLALKQVADSCLFLLGMFPTHRPESNSLYYDLGKTCYFSLGGSVNHQLSANFVKAVDLLLGVQMILEKDKAFPIWQSTKSIIALRMLKEQNIIPLRRFK